MSARPRSPRRGAAGLALLLALAGVACTRAPGGGAGDTGLFSHDRFFKVTGSHQGFSCDQCHPPGAPSFQASQGGVDCLGCHDQTTTAASHGGVSGFDYATPSCIACHKDGTAAVDHTKLFPIATGDLHGGIGCSQCHGATRAVADLQCTTCHGHHDQAQMDADHAGLANYAYASPSCYGCHQDSSVPLPANHDAAYFPVTGTPHATVGCSQCHGATRAVTDVTCVPCHVQADATTAHAAIPGTSRGRLDGVTYTNYQYATAFCLKCHADGPALAIASHPAFPPAGSGCANVGDRRLGSSGHPPMCLTCHTAAVQSGKTWATDFAQYGCRACHTDDCGAGGGG